LVPWYSLETLSVYINNKGSLFSFSVINKINRKILLIVSIAMNSACLFSFTITESYSILMLNRIIIGLFQAFISIYMPVWCDQYGPGEKKTIMISIIQTSTPLGVVLGYIITETLKRSYRVFLLILVD
jgi:predicted MFS family arabinose efflux permease